MFRTLTFLIVVCLAASPAKAATYHVAQNGDDANTCGAAQSTSSSKQKRTIAAGVACLVAGDTLVIHEGTYTGNGNIIDSQLFTVRSGKSFPIRSRLQARPESRSSSSRTTIREFG